MQQLLLKLFGRGIRQLSDDIYYTEFYYGMNYIFCHFFPVTKVKVSALEKYLLPSGPRVRLVKLALQPSLTQQLLPHNSLNVCRKDYSKIHKRKGRDERYLTLIFIFSFREIWGDLKSQESISS